jgi:hypothetical protein
MYDVSTPVASYAKATFEKKLFFLEDHDVVLMKRQVRGPSGGKPGKGCLGIKADMGSVVLVIPESCTLTK